MGPTTTKLPEALTPVWRTDAPNAEVDAYSGPIELKQDDKSFAGTGRVFLQWFPTCGLRFECEISGTSFSLPSARDAKLALLDEPGRPELEVILTKIDNIIEPKNISGRVRDLCLGDKTHLKHLMFHLPNFPGLKADAICNRTTGATWGGRHSLVADGRRITVDEIDQRDLQNRIKDESASGITHVGRIERENGNEFGLDDVDDLLECLRHFFSFCRTHWTSPLLFAGYDSTDKLAVRKFHAQNVTPVRSCNQWIDQDSDNVLEDLYTGFSQRWHDSNWNDAMRTCVYMYVDANLPAHSAEGGIIQLCTIFEALGWIEFVNTSTVTAKTFNSQHADRKLTDLLNHYGISTDLPPEMNGIVAEAAKHNRKLTNGPEAIMAIRNALTHPNPRSRRLFNSIGDYSLLAFTLANKYAGLCLLKTFGYQGRYVNYFSGATWKTEALEVVPWV